MNDTCLAPRCGSSCHAAFLLGGNHGATRQTPRLMPVPDTAAFIARWASSGASERANYALFLAELCDLIGVARPDPTKPDDADNAYVFERAVTFHHPDDRRARGASTSTSAPASCWRPSRASRNARPLRLWPTRRKPRRRPRRKATRSAAAPLGMKPCSRHSVRLSSMCGRFRERGPPAVAHHR